MKHAELVRRLDRITRIVWFGFGAMVLAVNCFAYLDGLPGPMPTGEAITPESNGQWAFFSYATSRPMIVLAMIGIIAGVFGRPLGVDMGERRDRDGRQTGGNR